MASYTSVGTYDAVARFPAFRGLMQTGDGINADARFAVTAKNVETRGGMLQSAPAHTLLAITHDDLTGAKIGTLARLHRRWHATEDEKDVLIAAAGGALYWVLEKDAAVAAWEKLTFPVGVTAWHSDAWSAVAYEINPEGSPASVDVLLLSNALDGMVMVRGDTLAVTTVETPKVFGQICRYNERIWGGAILSDPDMLLYSAPFDPTDWAANAEIPEDGAGDISQPSWDGDSFGKMVQFGSQLIALKKHRVWRVLGTNPGEFSFKEQYGGGASYPETVAMDGELMLFLSDDGLLAYDGTNVGAYYQDYARKTFERMNVSALDGACAVFYKGRYLCAVPLDESPTNNAVIVYDRTEQNWLLLEGVCVESWLATDRGLYFTSSTTPGRVWKWTDDAWSDTALGNAEWVSPWNDLSAKTSLKSAFAVYLLAEAKGDAELSVTLETERKAKTKTLPLHALAGGDWAKQKKMRFGTSGRRFRLKISCAGTVPWRLLSGVDVVMEHEGD